MTDETQLPEHVVSIHIDVPVQRVWDEITKTGRIQRALYNTVLESDLQPGSPLRYYSPDRKRVFVVGEVVEVDPPRETGRIPLKTRAMYRVMGWFTFLLPETTKPGYLDE